jgi:hypothetical protein
VLVADGHFCPRPYLKARVGAYPLSAVFKRYPSVRLQPRMQVTVSDKHSSLLRIGSNYDLKKVYRESPVDCTMNDLRL